MWTASARCQYRRSGERYASDVTDAEFALIAPLLPAAKRGGRPRTTVLREVVNAILYLLRTGCPWRMRREPDRLWHAMVLAGRSQIAVAFDAGPCLRSVAHARRGDSRLIDAGLAPCASCST